MIASVSDHTLSDGLLELDVIPYRHPLTAPGLYGFRIAADSVNAVALGMPAEDASHLRRTDAWDVGYFRVESFYDPQVTTVPLETDPPLNPGVGQEYEVEGTNGGNNDDAMSVKVTFEDFNQAGCTLTTMGRLPVGSALNCPYRAVPTVIDEAWTDVDELAKFFPSTDPPGVLEPLGSESDLLHVTVPREWAGMDDTIYEYEITLTSKLGEGSTFTLWLPRLRGADVITGDLAPAAPPTGTETVLVVEDQADLRNLVQIMLVEAGYHVIVGASPKEALALGSAAGVEIDLLLTDVVMPGMRGPQLVAELVRLRPDIQVVCLAGRQFQKGAACRMLTDPCQNNGFPGAMTHRQEQRDSAIRSTGSGPVSCFTLTEVMIIVLSLAC